MHAARVESLRQQITMDTPGDRCFIQARPATQPAIQGSCDQRVLVEVRENLGHDGPGEAAIDPERFHASQHSKPAPALHVGFGPGARRRGAAVVERALFAQPRHCGIDIGELEFPARQARSHLGFRQLAPCEQSEGGDVGVGHPLSVPVRLEFIA